MDERGKERRVREMVVGRRGRQKREKEDAGRDSVFLLRTLNCIYSHNYVHLTTRFLFFFQ